MFEVGDYVRIIDTDKYYNVVNVDNNTRTVLLDNYDQHEGNILWNNLLSFEAIEHVFQREAINNLYNLVVANTNKILETSKWIEEESKEEIKGIK